MKSIRFVHIADTHFDIPFTSLGYLTDKSSIRRQDIKVTFETIIEAVYHEKADFLFICGDLYEHSYTRPSTITFINESFKKISKTKVIIIPGNHDPWVKNSYYQNFNWSENVFILTQDNPYVEFKEKGVCLFSQYHDLNNINLNNINVLLLHGSVDFEFDKNSYNPISSKNLALAGMDYIALGHFHNRIDKVSGLSNAYNPGSPEPLGFDEPGKHGFLMGSISKNKSEDSILQIDFIPVNRKEYLELEVNITDCITHEEVINKINEKLENTFIDSQDYINEYSNLLLSINLTGYIDKQINTSMIIDKNVDTDIDIDIDIGYIVSYFEKMFFYIKIKNEALPNYDFNEIKNEIGLKGLFVSKILELIDIAKDEKEKYLLMKSLYYGIEALERGQVDIGDY